MKPLYLHKKEHLTLLLLRKKIRPISPWPLKWGGVPESYHFLQGSRSSYFSTILEAFDSNMVLLGKTL